MRSHACCAKLVLLSIVYFKWQEFFLLNSENLSIPQHNFPNPGVSDMKKTGKIHCVVKMLDTDLHAA